jgi:uncharacterized repeat protein (TIGR01451 family)
MTMRVLRPILVAGLGLALATPAYAVPRHGGLTVSVGHAPSRFLPGMANAEITITVSNRGFRPSAGRTVVTETLPAGVTATDVAGLGWTCTGTTGITCTRNDRLAPRSSYPPVRVRVDIAETVGEQVTSTAIVTANGRTSSGTELIPARDACPHGWSPTQTVSFAPPASGVDSGVPNPERADGCTLLDVIWNAEPFADHKSFVTTVRRTTGDFARAGLLTRGQQHRIDSAAARSAVGTRLDRQVDNSCSKRIALTYDDGPSAFRPQLLRLLREKQVHGTLFDNGVRIEPNPALTRFQVREGHVQLNHTYTHPHMNELALEAAREEVVRNEAVHKAARAPITFAGIAIPFSDTSPELQRMLLEMGYTFFLNRTYGDDWLPDKPATAIRDDILAQLKPGAIIALHDGTIDTTSGAATVEATGLLIDAARQLGYCFGVVDHSGQVIASRYVSSGTPIPPITAPVPYHLPLAFGVPEDLPKPWVRIPSPLHIAATHSPAAFAPGQRGNTLSVTVTNVSNAPSDGSPVTIVDPIPAGLTATGAAGNGWTCSGAEVRTCTRTDVLAPKASYPPIVFTVDVSANPPASVVNAPTLSAHGQAWTHETTDTIPLRQ